MTSSFKQRTRRFLEEALLFYHEHNISLSYEPKSIYIPQEHPQQAIACVLNEGNYLQETIEFFSSRFLQRTYKDSFSLEMSNAALQELTNVYLKLDPTWIIEQEKKREEKEVLKRLMGKAQIALFLPAQRLPPEILFYTLVHELWHLIEQEQGLLSKPSLITEGTATFVALYAIGAKARLAPEQCTTQTQLLYTGAAYTLQEILQGEKDILHKLLEHTWREKIQEIFYEKVYHFFERRLFQEQGDLQESLENFLHKTPLFFDKGEITQASILQGYRSIGATLFANELEKQDMTKILQALKEVQLSKLQ